MQSEYKNLKSGEERDRNKTQKSKVYVAFGVLQLTIFKNWEEIRCQGVITVQANGTILKAISYSPHMYINC